MNTVQAPVKAALAAAQQEQGVDSAAKGRLVVVVPDIAEPALLAARIQHVAGARRQDVFMLGVASRAVSESEMRRKLTLLAAFLQGSDVKVQFWVKEAKDWMPALEAVLGDSDLLACCVVGGPPSRGAGWLDQLSARFERPVYAFMDGDGIREGRPGPLRRLSPWLASIGTMAGFFWLQVWLSQPGEGGAYSGWLPATALLEIGLIWLINVLME